MDLGVISVRYARALLRCALEEKAEKEVFASMQTFLANNFGIEELKFTIESPQVTKAQKKLLLLAAFNTEEKSLVARFLDLVISEGRLNALVFIASSYIRLYREHEHITDGRLITASRVDEATEAKLKKMVEAKAHMNVEFQTEVDPSLIGGFVLEYDTYRLDASIKSKLHRILAELKK